MTGNPGGRDAPLVLLVNNQEWTARSVESVLRPAGYAVLKAYTGKQATELASRARPDLVIVDYRLSDMMGLAAVETIRALPTVDRATPFVILTAANLGRQERHQCFKAGIWEVFSSPFDPVELLCKLETFLYAQKHSEDAWEMTHKDPGTGFYNLNGLLTRAGEMVADAQRNARWVACVALGPRQGEDATGDPATAAPPEIVIAGEHREKFRTESPGPQLVDRIALTLGAATRTSDSKGHVGSTDFLILAPGTDEQGAELMANRLVGALNERVLPVKRRKVELEFSAGYYAAYDRAGGQLVAQDLLGRTTQALRSAQGSGAKPVLSFHLA